MPVSLRQKVVWVMGREWLPGHIFQCDTQDFCHQPSLLRAAKRARISVYPESIYPSATSDTPISSSVSGDLERFWVDRVLTGEERFITVKRIWIQPHGPG